MICVSVIIPVYNMQQYLEQCLDSVVSQSLKEIEIICINDGSTDYSENIIKKYQNRDSRVKLISQLNQGVSKARNNGILAAAGKYVIFMDPDDYYPDENVLNDLYCAAIENKVKICGGSFTEDRGTYVTDDFTEINYGYTFYRDGLIQYQDYQFDYGYHRFIYDRKMLLENNILFPNYIRYQDPPFFVCAMVCAEEFYALKRPSYRYRFFGFQNIRWDNQRLYDMLSAMRDILIVGRENKLYEIQKLTIRRINEQYRDIIIENIMSKDENIIKLLFEIEELVVSQNEIDADIIPLFTRIIELREQSDERIRQLEQCSRQAIEQKEESIRQLGYIVNSRSYRIYRRLMNCIPEWLLRYIRNGRI